MENLDHFRKDALAAHNNYRAKHKAPPLVLSNDICNHAQNYANYLASKDIMVHSGGKWGNRHLGENLAMCGGKVMTGQGMSEQWYSEIKYYNYKHPGFNHQTGHFTQLVWRNSKEVGFGVARSRSGRYYGVANYYPPGNFTNHGEFEKNVLP